MVHTFRITDNLLSPHSERIVVFRSFNCTAFRGEGGIELELPFPVHGQFILVDDLHNFFVGVQACIFHGVWMMASVP